MNGDPVQPSTAEGGCRCGRVRFRVTGAPLLTAACHCRGCQLMSASAFSLTGFYPAAQFELLSGDPVPGGLHGDNRHMHCPNCMSWVFTQAHGLDHLVNVRTALLDSPPAEPPFIDTYVSEALPWAQTGAKHRFDAFPPAPLYPELIGEFASQRQGFPDTGI